jgi:hypothetical protein
MLGTSGNSVRSQRFVARLALQALTVVSLVLDAVAPRMAGLESLAVESALEKYVLVMEEAVVAAAEVVAAGDDALEPCNAEPIPSWRLEDFLRPSQQTPEESYMEGFLHLRMSVACLALSFFALVAAILDVFSLPLACVCLLQPWHGASFSSILLRLAIAVEEQATGP